MNKTIRTLVAGILAAASIIACKKEDKPALPVVTTGEITAITTQAATVSSTVSFEDNTPIIARGICIGTSTNPTIENQFTLDSLVSGPLSTTVSGLRHSTTYYVRAYATNSVGIEYGEEKSFTTAAIGLPVLSPITAVNKSIGVYNIAGTIVSAGNGTILSKGICVSSNPKPTINDNCEAYVSNDDSIKGIISGGNYDGTLYICSYATNESGTAYSDAKPITFYYYGEPDPNCPDCPIALKPNIYLYPTKAEQLQVSLSFPQNGNVVASLPEYGQGWNVNVQPDGTIDSRYGYLFYESAQPDVWQKSQGWSVKTSDLKAFFEQNLAQYGFAGKEISDFTEYWIPLLTQYEYFSIFPQNKQTVASVISLNISHTPDNIQRLFYYIEGLSSKASLPAPRIEKDFSRNGFYATEWGVVLAKGTNIK